MPMTRVSDPASTLNDPIPPTVQPDGSRPPRVVIDTAVIVSALVFGGSQSTRLRRAWRHGYCRPMLCRATLIDLMQALARPEFGFTPHEQQTLLGEFLPHALKVRAPGVMPPDASQPLMLPSSARPTRTRCTCSGR